MFHEATAQFCSLPAPKTEGFNPPGEALVQRGMTALFLEPPHYYYFKFSIYCIFKNASTYFWLYWVLAVAWAFL